MRRVWAAAAIFAVTAALCLFGCLYTVWAAQSLLEQTVKIEDAVYEESYETAMAIAEKAERQWNSSSRVFCGFFSHAQLETADRELVSLRVSLEQQDRTAALKSCRQLALFCSHLRKMDLPLPENIL